MYYISVHNTEWPQNCSEFHFPLVFILFKRFNNRDWGGHVQPPFSLPVYGKLLCLVWNGRITWTFFYLCGTYVNNSSCSDARRFTSQRQNSSFLMYSSFYMKLISCFRDQSQSHSLYSRCIWIIIYVFYIICKTRMKFEIIQTHWHHK